MPKSFRDYLSLFEAGDTNTYPPDLGAVWDEKRGAWIDSKGGTYIMGIGGDHKYRYTPPGNNQSADGTGLPSDNKPLKPLDDVVVGTKPSTSKPIAPADQAAFDKKIQDFTKPEPSASKPIAPADQAAFDKKIQDLRKEKPPEFANKPPFSNQSPQKDKPLVQPTKTSGFTPSTAPATKDKPLGVTVRPAEPDVAKVPPSTPAQTKPAPQVMYPAPDNKPDVTAASPTSGPNKQTTGPEPSKPTDTKPTDSPNVAPDVAKPSTGQSSGSLPGPAVSTPAQSNDGPDYWRFGGMPGGEVRPYVTNAELRAQGKLKESTRHMNDIERSLHILESMSSAEKKSTGPKFPGYWKGTDSAEQARNKMVGSAEQEESIIRELDTTAKETATRRGLEERWKSFKEADVNAADPEAQTFVPDTPQPTKPAIQQSNLGIADQGLSRVFGNLEKRNGEWTHPGGVKASPQLAQKAERSVQSQPQSPVEPSAAAQSVAQTAQQQPSASTAQTSPTVDAIKANWDKLRKGDASATATKPQAAVTATGGEGTPVPNGGKQMTDQDLDNWLDKQKSVDTVPQEPTIEIKPTNWKELYKLNPNIKNPNLIYPGQEIKLPTGEKYIVQKGDSLSKIAKWHNSQITADTGTAALKPIAQGTVPQNQQVATVDVGEKNKLTMPDYIKDQIPGVESGDRDIDPRTGKLITSPAGAVGRWQTMPDTLTDPGFGVEPARDNSPEERARVGRQYADAMYNRYNGDPEKALAAYNWGPGNLDKALASAEKSGKDWRLYLPKETSQHIKKFNYAPPETQVAMKESARRRRDEPPEANYDDEYDAMVARVRKLAGLGPLKTVWDPVKRVYKNVPVNQEKKVDEENATDPDNQATNPDTQATAQPNNNAATTSDSTNQQQVAQRAQTVDNSVARNLAGGLTNVLPAGVSPDDMAQGITNANDGKPLTAQQQKAVSQITPLVMKAAETPGTAGQLKSALQNAGILAKQGK